MDTRISGLLAVGSSQDFLLSSFGPLGLVPAHTHALSPEGSLLCFYGFPVSLLSSGPRDVLQWLPLHTHATRGKNLWLQRNVGVFMCGGQPLFTFSFLCSLPKVRQSPEKQERTDARKPCPYGGLLGTPGQREWWGHMEPELSHMLGPLPVLGLEGSKAGPGLSAKSNGAL